MFAVLPDCTEPTTIPDRKRALVQATPSIAPDNVLGSVASATYSASARTTAKASGDTAVIAFASRAYQPVSLGCAGSSHRACGTGLSVSTLSKGMSPTGSSRQVSEGSASNCIRSAP
ncbi:MAG: hypothetical protein JW395_0985 [Nitrospira sp.]|nr:hypothetical protein [Nitrospira sp.]